MKKHNINYDIQCSYDDQVRYSLYDKWRDRAFEYEDVEKSLRIWAEHAPPNERKCFFSGNRTR